MGTPEATVSVQPRSIKPWGPVRPSRFLSSLLVSWLTGYHFPRFLLTPTGCSFRLQFANPSPSTGPPNGVFQGLILCPLPSYSNTFLLEDFIHSQGFKHHPCADGFKMSVNSSSLSDTQMPGWLPCLEASQANPADVFKTEVLIFLYKAVYTLSLVLPALGMAPSSIQLLKSPSGNRCCSSVLSLTLAANRFTRPIGSTFKI